jgi:GrpB-like predicted nucleotidyltransferase (UPF0157 family)
VVSEKPDPRRPDVRALELVGGPEPLTVAVEEYDQRWATIYQEHRRRITEALRAADARAGQGALTEIEMDVQIEHIGSTSVPGLAAKPIVDIVIVVEDITAEEDYLDPLLAAGYVLRVREPGHRLVRTPARDVHVHLLERGDPAIDEYLLFRDQLRRDPADRALYERTKRDLLTRRWDDMNAYADAKTDVIQQIKSRARAQAARRSPGL